MARASTAAENASLNGLDGTAGASSIVGWVSLHTGDPGTTGASEVTGGGYARLAVTWNAAAAGAKTNATALSFSTAGATAVTHFGTWTAVTAGSYSIGGALASPVTAATITVSSGSISLASA